MERYFLTKQYIFKTTNDVKHNISGIRTDLFLRFLKYFCEICFALVYFEIPLLSFCPVLLYFCNSESSKLLKPRNIN